jgi:hypothetical protein
MHDHATLKSLEIHRKQFVSALARPNNPVEMAKVARIHRFVYLGELFGALDDTRFLAIAHGANLCRAAMGRYLEMEAMFTMQEQGEDVVRYQVRNALLLGKSDRAVALLMSGTPAGPTYVLDMVKSALVDIPAVGNTMPVAVAALVSVGKIDDAVDLLMLTKQWKQAAKVLLNDGRFLRAFQIMRAVLEEEDIGELMDEVEQAAMVSGGIALIGAVVGLKKFELAAQLLTAVGRQWEAAVIRALHVQDGGYVLRLEALSDLSQLAKDS